MRAVLMALTVAIVGVLVLDTTAIVVGDQSSAEARLEHDAVPTRLPAAALVRAGLDGVSDRASTARTGPKTLSDSAAAARVDSQGRLHLSRSPRSTASGAACSSESLSPLNYGTYRFVTTAPLGTPRQAARDSACSYKPSQARYTNEIDLENSRALIGLGYPLDSQYVVQPYYKAEPHPPVRDPAQVQDRHAAVHLAARSEVDF